MSPLGGHGAGDENVGGQSGNQSIPQSVEGSRADETVRNGGMGLSGGEGDERWQMKFGGLPGSRNAGVGSQAARREMVALELQIETLWRENGSRAVYLTFAMPDLFFERRYRGLRCC